MCLFVQDGGGGLVAILSFLKTSIPRGDKLAGLCLNLCYIQLL